MKKFIKITLFTILIPFLLLSSKNVTFAKCIELWGIFSCGQTEVTNYNNYNWVRNNSNTHLDNIKSNNTSINWVGEFQVWTSLRWDQWIYNMIIKIARDIKNLFFVISSIYFLSIVFKLILSKNTEDEFWKFKKWIIWISLWIVFMQISYSFVASLSWWISWWIVWQSLWSTLIDNIVIPIINMAEIFASFIFIAVAIYAFFKIVTANWEEDKVKLWKMSVVYAIVWFIVIKIAKTLVDGVYWKINCGSSYIWVWIQNCIETAKLCNFAQVFLDIINWMNSFLWIIIIIMIIYVWTKVLLSGWEEEKLTSAKKSIMYIFIWLFIIMTNYLILIFFFDPSWAPIF
jgi:hypothetical protein